MTSLYNSLNKTFVREAQDFAHFVRFDMQDILDREYPIDGLRRARALSTLKRMAEEERSSQRLSASSV